MATSFRSLKFPAFKRAVLKNSEITFKGLNFWEHTNLLKTLKLARELYDPLASSVELEYECKASDSSEHQVVGMSIPFSETSKHELKNWIKNINVSNVN